MIRWMRAGELNATLMAYEASMTPVHLPAPQVHSAVKDREAPWAHFDPHAFLKSKLDIS
jgi:hypothetical protein